MRYSLKDVTLDRTTGRVVDGDRDRPQEVTEVWTFRRDNGGPWKVSAIQQAA
jgi:predicted lipid-binding transport protein (Tim44 family)